MSVNVDQIVVSNLSIITKALSILLVTKKVALLNHSVLFYLKLVDTSNTLKMVVNHVFFD